MRSNNLKKTFFKSKHHNGVFLTRIDNKHLECFKKEFTSLTVKVEQQRSPMKKSNKIL